VSLVLRDHHPNIKVARSGSYFDLHSLLRATWVRRLRLASSVCSAFNGYIFLTFRRRFAKKTAKKSLITLRFFNKTLSKRFFSWLNGFAGLFPPGAASLPPNNFSYRHPLGGLIKGNGGIFRGDNLHDNSFKNFLTFS
jgi:hypothetical protein